MLKMNKPGKNERWDPVLGEPFIELIGAKRRAWLEGALGAELDRYGNVVGPSELVETLEIQHSRWLEQVVAQPNLDRDHRIDAWKNTHL